MFPTASSSSSAPPASPSSFHPHMSAQVLTKLRIVGSLGTYGAETRRNEGWREGRGGRAQRERSCQGNVDPCHSSQRSGMDKWITTLSDCQGGIAFRFVVPQCLGLTFISLAACAWVVFMYTGIFRLFRCWNPVRCAQNSHGRTHTHKHKQIPSVTM